MNAKAPVAAGEFIRFMASPEIQKERAMRGGPLPTISSLYRDPDVLAFNPHYPLLYELLRTARRRHHIPHYLRVSRLLQRRLHAVLTGAADVDAALEALHREVGPLIQPANCPGSASRPAT